MIIPVKFCQNTTNSLNLTSGYGDILKCNQFRTNQAQQTPLKIIKQEHVDNMHNYTWSQSLL